MLLKESIRKRRSFRPLASLLLLFVSSTLLYSQVSQRTATIEIDAGKVENQISPQLYGQFLEFMFEGIKFGLHAELLRDRSFEESPNSIGLPRHWERYPDDRVDDYALTFLWDTSFAYPPKKNPDNPPAETGPEHSLRVDAGDGVFKHHGLYQSGVPIRAGLTYRGYLWLKADSYSGKITLTLESGSNVGHIYASAELSVSKGDWRKYEFNLQPAQSDPLASFVIGFPGRGRIWIDQVSLMPGDIAPGEVRRDVFEQAKLLRPSFIRWPGGNVAQDYHWLWGIGPRDKRVTWRNLSWRNEPEPSDFGTDEFVSFARAVGAEPSITVNVEGRGATVSEAAAWVEYCNGATNTRYGAVRAANGHPDSYNIELWEVGNEIWGDWVRGHSDAETYARNFQRYAQAMRAVDPGIKLIAVGDNDMSWNRTVLKLAGENIDYLAIHHYYGHREMAGDAANLMARPLHYARFYEQVASMIRELVPNRKIQLAINEWGLDLPEERQYSMESALYAARLMNVFERTGLVGLSAVSDLVNGWPGGIIQAGRHGLFVSPIFLVNQLYAEHLGSARLATVVDCPTFDSSKEGKKVPLLDVAASRTDDGRRIYIKVVNTDPHDALSTTISLENTQVVQRAEIHTISASLLTTANSFATPKAVSVKTMTIPAKTKFRVNLPRHSVSLISLTVR